MTKKKLTAGQRKKNISYRKALKLRTKRLALMLNPDQMPVSQHWRSMPAGSKLMLWEIKAGAQVRAVYLVVSCSVCGWHNSMQEKKHAGLIESGEPYTCRNCKTIAHHEARLNPPEGEHHEPALPA